MKIQLNVIPYGIDQGYFPRKVSLELEIFSCQNRPKYDFQSGQKKSMCPHLPTTLETTCDSPAGIGASLRTHAQRTDGHRLFC